MITRKSWMLAGAAAWLGCGCVTNQPTKEEAKHILSTDSYSLFYTSPAPRSSGRLDDSNGQLSGRINEMKDSFAERKPKVHEVMIFVHGGLNDGRVGLNGAIEKDQALANDGSIFPIFLTWNSGIFSTYGWHLARDANGISDVSDKNHGDEWRAVSRVPTNFVADMAEGVGSAPRTFRNAYTKWLENSNIVDDHTKWGLMTRRLYEKRMRELFAGWKATDGGYHRPGEEIHDLSGAVKVPYEISAGKEGGGMESGFSDTWGIIGLPVETALSPIYQGMGRPAWESMQRRAHTLVYRHPTEIDLGGLAKDPKADGVLPEILRTVRGWQKKDPTLRVTFVGHSMGTIALNEAFRAMADRQAEGTSCEVRVDRIIYLAAACSIYDFTDTAGRYLENHHQCEMYNVCLNPRREVGEKFYPAVPLVFSGSLLTWIDQFFQSPRDFPDRTFGSFANCVIAYKFMPQTSRFHLKSFDDKESFFNTLRPEAGPQKHGEMSDFRFWEPDFYKPVKEGQKPHYRLLSDKEPSVAAAGS